MQLSAEDRARIESLLGHTFSCPDLLDQALTHASLVETRLDSNERMEFLGDAVLGLVACEMIYRRFPGMLEGEMTKVKSLTVSRDTCAKIGRQIGLAEWLKVGKGMQVGDDAPSSLSAAALESVIAAIYLDGGFDAAKRFLTPLIEPLIQQAADSGHQHNFKSYLQQHAQQTVGTTPQYRVLDEQGPDHAKCFKVCVDLAGRRFEASWGQSKKRAEQMAALNALIELGVLNASEFEAFMAQQAIGVAGK